MKKIHIENVKNHNRADFQTQQLRELSRTYLTLQEYRISNANRLVKTPQNPADIKKESEWKSRAEKLDDLMIPAPLKMATYEEYFSAQLRLFSKIEDELKKKIKETLKGHEIWESFLKEIKGVGPIIAASLIGEIGDIRRFERTSDLWAYAGKHTINGSAVRLRKNQKANWNKYLPLALWKFSQQIIYLKNKENPNEYIILYKKRLKYEKEKHDNTCKGTYVKGKYIKCKAPQYHSRLRADRYIQKKLLSYLYWHWKGVDA